MTSLGFRIHDIGTALAAWAAAVLGCSQSVAAAYTGADQATSTATNAIIESYIKEPLSWSKTPVEDAFHTWALPLMLTQVNRSISNWNLLLPRPIVTNDIAWRASRSVGSFGGAIWTKDNRFIWQFSFGNLTHFEDFHFSAPAERGATVTSDAPSSKHPLDAEGAVSVARNALHAAGLTEEMLHIAKTPIATQENRAAAV